MCSGELASFVGKQRMTAPHQDCLIRFRSWCSHYFAESRMQLCTCVVHLLCLCHSVLGIKRGGDAALVALAQLAGSDYDTGGADHVGESLALGAVRCLLRGCEVRWPASAAAAGGVRHDKH